MHRIPAHQRWFLEWSGLIDDFFHMNMHIFHSKLVDIDVFRDFWNAALSYQRQNKLPLWPSFPKWNIEQEIQSGLHFSVRSVDGALTGYFSLALSDHVIWESKECGDAIYIHRMCVNPDRKGGNLTSSVLAWANEYASGLGRKFVRMDTWADNERLVDYYIKRGFRYIGIRQMGDAPELPLHYSFTRLALFENQIC